MRSPIDWQLNIEDTLYVKDEIKNKDYLNFITNVRSIKAAVARDELDKYDVQRKRYADARYGRHTKYEVGSVRKILAWQLSTKRHEQAINSLACSVSNSLCVQ